MGLNIRKKGADAEIEVCKRLQPFFPNTLQRNLEQVRSGGSDVDGSWPFVIEVKRVEDCCMGNKNSWWKQVNAAVVDPAQEIPVVVFRPSRSSWRYLLAASFVTDGDLGWVECSEETFLKLVMETYK